jgi:glutathione S-transferase
MIDRWTTTMPQHPYSIQNPVFLTYMIAAALMILKLMAQGWMTVYRMIKSDSGLLNPEDLAPGSVNRNPRPQQLELNEYVDRSRRIQRNDLENIPAFLVAGLLFVAVRPSPLLADALMGTFVVARLLHTAAYLSKQRHEIRAVLFTIGSLVVIYMGIHVLIVAVSLL